jgi:ATP-dependent exoDNAse (exonuclease V) beta subunit
MKQTTGTRPPASGLPDQDARDAIQTDLDATIVVEAAAGTGKTTALVSRILRVIEDGRAEIGGIVAVTFTEKAAGELKLRLRGTLEAARNRLRTVAAQGAAGREARLDEALKNLEEAHIGTIHAFCADLLRERPVEARVDPLFAVLTDAQAERLYGEAFDLWLQEQLADPPEGVRRALRRSATPSFVARAFRPVDSDGGPIDRLRAAGRALVEWRDFRAPWTRKPFAREAEIDRLVEQIHQLAELTAQPSYARDNLFLDTAAIRMLSTDVRRSGDVRGAGLQARRSEGYDALESRLIDLARDRKVQNARHGRGPDYAKGVTRASVVAALDSLRVALDQFRSAADADLAALLQQELQGSLERYAALKRRVGALDFLDLLLKTRDLLSDDTGVRRAFQRRFARIFVDEFQDTDPLQAEILLMLAADDSASGPRPPASGLGVVPGKLFIVGDPKQSIYRFRRADVAVYRQVCEQLVAQGARHLELTTSFRALPQIQACINAAFEPVMDGDEPTLQARYVPLTPYRADDAKRPSVVALPVPEPYGTRNLSAIRIEQSLPHAVGAFVEWLVNRSKWQIVRGFSLVPIHARDICILFRRFLSFGDDVTRPYVEALEARGVPHVLVGGRTFHEREEVETIRAALAAIEWPDDELSVFATLRGALFAIGDEDLLEWKHRYRGFHPFRIPEEFVDGSAPGHLRPIAEALRLLQQLHRRRNYRPVADTIGDLLDATRAHVGFVLRSGGEQALANVLHVAELARQHELGGGISFRGFVEELREASESAQSAEAPILEEGSDGVRLMTVHKAKGLEFPVVILADLTCRLSRGEAGRWIDPDRRLCALKLGGWAPHDLLLHDGEEAARDRAEAMRLAYVAATRARDLLVVPAIGDEEYDGGWLEPLNRAIYPSLDARRAPARAPGCPEFKSKDSVLNRPDGDPARPPTVAPGLYRLPASGLRPSASASYSVVWWDPRVLDLQTDSTLGLRRDDLIVKDVDLLTVEEGLAAYEGWKEAREGAIVSGSAPSLQVHRATEWIRSPGLRPPAPGLPVEVIEVSGSRDRPHGARFGTLVHAVLAAIPLDADAETVRRFAETHGRILGATEPEVAGASDAVAGVLGHPLMRRARAAQQAGRLRRELPIVQAIGGALVEGTVDLLLHDEEGALVVDFKTDRELEEDFERYRRQVEFYCAALTALVGQPPRGAIVRV